MHTLYNGFIVQLVLSGALFALLAYFVIKNARLKKEIDRLVSASKEKVGE